MAATSNWHVLRPLAIVIITVSYTIHADVMLFPAPNKTLSGETMPYMSMLHTGTEADDFYTRGRFGVDFTVIGYDFDRAGTTTSHNKSLGDRDCTTTSHNKKALGLGFGISAAAHINMLPNSDMYFPVDNFYATLAVHFSGAFGDKLSWRLYPVYHVSAHLADGYPDNIMKRDVRAVSSEMVRGEAYYKPLGGLLELGAGAGWYYHVCAQEELKYRGDISILVTPPLSLLGGSLHPFVLIRAEDVVQDGHNPGVDASAGMFALKNGRGFGLSVRYFNKLHSSYYFERYEKGWGAEYTFAY